MEIIEAGVTIIGGIVSVVKSLFGSVNISKIKGILESSGFSSLQYEKTFTQYRKMDRDYCYSVAMPKMIPKRVRMTQPFLEGYYALIDSFQWVEAFNNFDHMFAFQNGEGYTSYLVIMGKNSEKSVDWGFICIQLYVKPSPKLLVKHNIKKGFFSTKEWDTIEEMPVNLQQNEYKCIGAIMALELNNSPGNKFLTY